MGPMSRFVLNQCSDFGRKWARKTLGYGNTVDLCTLGRALMIGSIKVAALYLVAGCLLLGIVAGIAGGVHGVSLGLDPTSNIGSFVQGYFWHFSVKSQFVEGLVFSAGPVIAMFVAIATVLFGAGALIVNGVCWLYRSGRRIVRAAGHKSNEFEPRVQTKREQYAPKESLFSLWYEMFRKKTCVNIKLD